MFSSKLVKVQINNKPYVLISYDAYLDLMENRNEITNPDVVAALNETINLADTHTLEEIN